MVTGLYAALAGVFLIVLSVRVIGQRRAGRVSVGHGGRPDLERAMRVHANFTEYVPLCLLMLGLAELQGLPAWAVHAVGVLLMLARLAHFLGMRTPEAPGALRVAGMVGTFTVLGVLAPVLALRFAARTPAG